MRLGPIPRLGRFPEWPPLLASEGPGGVSDVHAHHAMHLVLARTGTIELTVDDVSVRCAGVLTAPDVAHAIDATKAFVLIVFVEPESELGASLRRTFVGESRMITEDERARLVDEATPEAIHADAGAAYGARIAEVLGARLGVRAAIDPRVRAVLRLLRTSPPDADLSLDALAAEVDLSPGRLMHLFTESVGIPIRPYVAWCRLARAAEGIARGRPLAEVAADAGYSDAGHLARSVRRAFGVTPSMLRPRSIPAS